MRDDGDESAILIAKGDADDQRGAGLAGLIEVDQPDLTAPGSPHLLGASPD